MLAGREKHADAATGRPGLVLLFGSGETSASGRRAFDWLFARVPRPVRVAILETPAGFQPNSAQVAGRIADFLRQRLQEYDPQTTLVPARRRDSPWSPDDPAVVSSLIHSNVIFLGPGSPTYAVRQLHGSLAWQILNARHRFGAVVVFASAAVVAAGSHAIPVYEIYKAGDDLHWTPGLDFFGAYGLRLVLVPHWNNTEGGAELDTSRCFMGQARFQCLLSMLPGAETVLGIDEHTVLAMDLRSGSGHVMGAGGITVRRDGVEHRFLHGQSCQLSVLGSLVVPPPDRGIPSDVWHTVQQADAARESIKALTTGVEPPLEVLSLVAEREAARARRDWPAADLLRERVQGRGWRISDTPQGPRVEAMLAED